MDFLDAPGEWFYDKNTKMIFYKSRQGEALAKAEVIIPKLEQLIELNNASYISFKNIIFEYSTWLMDDKDRIGIQVSWRYHPSEEFFIPSAIHVTHSSHIHFAGCIFQHLGGGAIEFEKATHYDSVDNCVLTDISGNGITILGDPGINNKESYCENKTIRRNRISKTGQDYTGCVGIFGAYPVNVKIENNEVFDMPYTGISVGWGWPGWTGDSGQGAQPVTSLKYNLIVKNNVHNVMQLHNDGGGIYTLQKQPGTCIADNWIHDMPRSPWSKKVENWEIAGIYLDQGSNEITVEHNVITDVDTVLYNHKYYFDKFERNTVRNNNSRDPKVEANAGPSKTDKFAGGPREEH